MASFTHPVEAQLRRDVQFTYFSSDRMTSSRWRLGSPIPESLKARSLYLLGFLVICAYGLPLK